MVRAGSLGIKTPLGERPARANSQGTHCPVGLHVSATWNACSLGVVGGAKASRITNVSRPAKPRSVSLFPCREYFGKTEITCASHICRAGLRIIWVIFTLGQHSTQATKMRPLASEHVRTKKEERYVQVHDYADAKLVGCPCADA
jgi:hypothetical protein